MEQAKLFQWVELRQNVPHSSVIKGDRGVILEYLQPTQQRPEPGYTLEIFRDGETLDVISIPVSWVSVLPEIWGQAQPSAKLLENC